MSQELCRCGNVNLLVYLLVISFAISSWVDINGLFVELPILVQNLPEGWDLPSYMSVIIQAANISPLVYTIASTVWPHRLLEVPVIYVIISLGGLVCLLLAFLWNVTSPIAGAEHSTALFGLQFFLGLVDTTSSVAFMPFMSKFKPQYMTAYFIGEGFSGLIPSLVALAQGAGSMICIQVQDNMIDTHSSSTAQVYPNSTVSSFLPYPVYQEARFSVRIFFLILMLLMMASGVSFTLLNNWSYCKREQVSVTSNLQGQQAFSPCPDNDSVCDTGSLQRKEDMRQTDKKKRDIKYKPTESWSNRVGSQSTFQKPMSRSKYALFLFLTAWLNSLANSVLPALQSYSCLPYGIQAYHLSATLSSIANPVACFVTFCVKMTSTARTVAMAFLSTGLAFYLILTAATSPEPPLVDHASGPFVVVLCWVVAVLILTYTKVSIATEFRNEGKRALLWVGVCQQAGSLVGAMILFTMISILKLFQIANPCL